MDKQTERCVLCGETLGANEHNNPAPVRTGGNCCRDCNDALVVPARLRDLYAAAE